MKDEKIIELIKEILSFDRTENELLSKLTQTNLERIRKNIEFLNNLETNVEESYSGKIDTCPFCGEIPEINQVENIWNKNLSTKLICTNSKCQVNPQMIGINKIRVINYWNDYCKMMRVSSGKE